MKEILVPTDFSACANNATQVALDLAERFRGRLHLLTRIETPSHWPSPLASASSPVNPEREQRIHNAQVLLAEWQSRAQQRGVELRTHWATGPLLPLIENYVAKQGIDFVVMGSHGASGKRDYLIGSNTQKVVRTLRHSVLIIKEDISDYVLRRVIFTSNFDAHEMPAFHYLLDLLRPFQPEIHLVQIDTASWFSQPRVLVRDAMNDFEAAAEGFVCHQHFFRDWSVDAGIRNLSTSIDAQLIGISNQYQHPLKRLLVGSNVEALVNHAQIPVLSIVVPETSASS
ncbi:MAG: universal stress protein [Bacteroidota bacterium]